MDALDFALKRKVVPPNWYDRDCEWYEVITYRYKANGRIQIMGMMAYYNFNDALEDARRFAIEFNDSWRIVKHGDMSIKIAESKLT